MNQYAVTISSSIIEYTNRLSAFFLEDYKKLLDPAFADLSTRQKIVIEFLRTQSRTVGEIAAYFSITAAAASQLVSKLEKQQYAKRDINPDNRREILVTLDEKGRRYVDMLDKLQMHLIEKYYLPLSSDDLRTLLELYAKLYAIALDRQTNET